MYDVTKNTIVKAKDKKGLIWLSLLALVGVVLVLISTNSSKDVQKEADFQNLDPAKYAKEIEERIETLCNKIDGVSSTYAVVTLKGGYKAIYASDYQMGSSSSKNATVILGSGSSEKGLLIGYENPEIAGVGIVCSGGDNYNIRKNIISVVSSAFDITSNKIFVSGS